MYEDNQAAIRFVQGQTLTERTRHIHREDSAIRELQRNKEINIQYINTAYNLADYFLGPLWDTRTALHRGSIGAGPPSLAAGVCHVPHYR